MFKPCTLSAYDILLTGSETTDHGRGQHLLSCEAALAETSHLIRRAGGTLDFVFEAMRRGRLSCPFHLDEEAEAVQRLLDRYRELPMSLADACLVRMAELYDGSPVHSRLIRASPYTERTDDR